MKPDKLQKKILITLLVLCLLTPTGILLPLYFDAGNAWGEWSARTLKELLGYVPQGLAKYSELWSAPLDGYTLPDVNPSVVHQSGFYIVCGITGATVTYIVMLLISKLIIKSGK